MEAIFDAMLYMARLKVEISAFAQPYSDLVHDLLSVVLTPSIHAKGRC